MHPVILDARQRVSDRLDSYLAGDAATFLTVAPWSADVRERLREYAQRGKLIRGSLVAVGATLFTDPPAGDACTDVGVALELIQSFLLVHDDIMDRDDTRRGAPAVHAQYRSVAPRDGDQYGVSLGICAGDVASLLAFDLLAGLDVESSRRVDLVRTVAREIAQVGLAQMQDVHHGYVDSVERDAILDVYTYKTGRYTFSLPLIAGMIVAGVDRSLIDRVGSIGEVLGRIFQVRDDHLGLYGDSAEIGKPAGSDVRENKFTLHRLELFARLPADDPLRDAFGKVDLSGDELDRVRSRMVESGAQAAVDRFVTEEEVRAREALAQLSLTPVGREVMEALVSYNSARVR